MKTSSQLCVNLQSAINELCEAKSDVYGHMLKQDQEIEDLIKEVAFYKQYAKERLYIPK